MTINRFPTSLARWVGGALGIAVLLAPLLSCGQDPNAEAWRHTEQVTDYIYLQSYGSSLTQNEKQNLEHHIHQEFLKALETKNE